MALPRATCAIVPAMFRARTRIVRSAVSALLLLLALLSCKNINRLLGRDKLRAPEVPAAPPALAMPGGEPREQARKLADALEDPKQRLAAWLRIYEALDVPVYGVTGEGLGKTAADTPGPYFWTVWLMSGLEKKATGVRLSDAGGILTLGLTGADSQAVGKALLEDIRANAKRSGAPAQLLAELVRERVRRGRSRVDLLDEKVGTELVIDLPTVHLLSWLSFRGALARSHPDGKTGSLGPGDARAPNESIWARVSPAELTLIPEAHAAAGGFNCSELLGDKETTGWVKGVLKLAGGGGSLAFEDGAKAGLPKTSELVAKALGASGDGAKKIGSATSYANTVTSALSTYLAIHFMALRIDSDPPQLERTKKTTDGKEQKHRIQIITDSEGFPDGKNLEACLTSFGLNAFGVSFKLPEDGKGLSGVGVQFKEGTGFDRVLWGNYKHLKQLADDKGFVDLTILGRAQKRDLPDSAKSWETEYSFFVEAQPEKEDLGSIVNMFWSSLKAAGGAKASGLAGPILQLAKVTHWSLGEQAFVVIDWKPPGWKVSGKKDEAVFSGQVCDLEKEFRIQLGGGLSGHATYHPDKHYPASGGRYDYSGSFPGGTAFGNGTYAFSGDPWTSLKLTQTGAGCVTHPMGKNCADGTEILTLTATQECSR
ncbi:MAG: hypothetical protein AMXMBFR56_63740 [Polyangiaceae bacterium]